MHFANWINFANKQCKPEGHSHLPKWENPKEYKFFRLDSISYINNLINCKAKPKMGTYVYETVNQNISTNNKLQIYW